MIFLSFNVSIYGTKTLVSGTSTNDDFVRGEILNLMARARIFAASARVMKEFGRNVPSLYPLIHQFFTANVIYSAYHIFLSTSLKSDSVQIKVYRHESARTSIFTNSARVIDLNGSKNSSLSATPDFW